LVLTLGFLSSAWGEQRAYIQRVEVEPYFLGLARVRVYANIVRLSGQIIEGFKPEELVLTVNERALKYPPGVLKFSHLGEPLDLVLVVQVTKSYAEALEQLEAPVVALIKDLGKTLKGSQVGIVTFGGEAKQIIALASPEAAGRAWARKVLVEEEAAPPRLKDAVDKAKRILQSSRAARKLIVVIGDGHNEDSVGQDDNFARGAKLPKELVDKDIVVDTIGFDPSGRRAVYMLNLGQLSRLTHGFPRLAKEPESLARQIESLGAELRSAVVLTYFVPMEEVAGKNIKLACRSAVCGFVKGETEPLVSNPIRNVKAACGQAACDGRAVCVRGECVAQTMAAPGAGIWLWLAILGFVGGGIGLGVALVRRKKSPPTPAPMPAPIAPTPSAAVPALPDFSHLPYMKNYQQHLPPGYAMPAAPAAPAPVAAPRVSSFLILSGPRTGQQWPLRHGFTIGKAAGVDLVIDDGFASGHHAQVHVDGGGGVTLVDLHSTNGTFVNGVRTQTQRLTHGASIRIGQTEMRFLQG